MRLRDIQTNPLVARRYMERYINNGSPSGFTQKFTSSTETNPFGNVPFFNLWAVTLKVDRVEDFGDIPEWLDDNVIPIHPDMTTQAIFAANDCTPSKTCIRVCPTASVRTVEVIDFARGGYLKLHYNGLLGRVNRRLTRSHALAALDVTSILDRASGACQLPERFGYFAEHGARIASFTDEHGACVEWGTVFREIEPKPYRQATVFLIPAFALFATDPKNPNGPTLLLQLAKVRGVSIDEYVSEIVTAIVSCYFEMLLHYALQFECNAQNLVLGFSVCGSITSVNFRDFESVDKDLSLVEALGLNISFSSYPFKCVHRDLYNYNIKHSFMYDFKLGEYVLTPLIRLLPPSKKPRVIEGIRTLARHYISQLPAGFFPADGLWYNYANVVVDKTKERPYVGNPEPRYR